MRILKSIIYGAFVFIILSCNRGEKSVADEIDYNFQIRPILSDKCYKCHGPDANTREAGLRLDTPEGAYAALKDNPHAKALVPGSPETSEIYLRLISKDPGLKMPPKEANLDLNNEEIELIKKWIEQGGKYKPHWAFIKPEKKPLPKADKDWVKNEIDHFTYQKMKSNGLQPNPEAEKEILLKRLSLDITGLPPSVEMQKRFANNTNPDAYEKMIDELLKSKHFGERMALDWMDVARYADSHGYQDDGLRTMWPWRDWVIHAFNQNYSYKKFVTWQLAGDLIKDKNQESILATGFNRNHKITQEGGVIDEEYRSEYVTDRTGTFGKAFLSLTFECAKCHDHKYDPISQKDFFSTYAFFNQVPEKGLYGTIDASFADPPNMKIGKEEISGILKFINKKDTADVLVMVMADSAQKRKTHILERGNYDTPGAEVNFGLPKNILAYSIQKYGDNREGLVKWMFDKDNPLTARVFVNRLWAQFFGRGIVGTTGDFGMQGDLPTHPELLDWLAVDFMENNWDIKRLIKKMLMSATYRQSSKVLKEHTDKDPENMYLARSSRTRLKAELVRDLALFSSEIINNEIGGPSIKPYQPDGIWEKSTSGRGTLAKYVQDEGSDLYRRGLYVFIKRTVPPPNMLIFDASNRDQCEVTRMSTNTPLQALVMLNDPVITEASRVLAQKLMSKNTDDKARITEGFRRIVCRTPKPKEMSILVDFWEKETLRLKNQSKKNWLEVGEFKQISTKNPERTAALMYTIQMIYNLEETIVKV
jgi:hypothetical protein